MAGTATVTNFMPPVGATAYLKLACSEGYIWVRVRQILIRVLPTVVKTAKTMIIRIRNNGIDTYQRELVDHITD